MDNETKSFIRFFFACKKRFKKMTFEDLEKYQLKKAQALVQYVTEKSPFFQAHYNNQNLHDVWNLPIVNKKIMMDNFTEYTTLGFQKEELLDFCLRIEQEQNFTERFHGYNVAMSSGTSGSKGIVITSPEEEKYLQAALFSRFVFPKVLRIKWAFILRITTPAFQVSKFGQQLTHFNLQLPIEELREKLQQFQPNILSAPPSMLSIIAKEVQNGRLTIKPKRIISYAEVLYPEVKTEIEETFDTLVHQIYQGSEGSIAMTCKCGNLHINEDLMKVQLFDNEGNLTESGKPCHKMIVTDLNKISQPIIRYELNDIITISPEKCSCGSNFRVIEQVMGRADDLFWGQRENTDELQFIFPDYIRRAIISSSEEISEYQAIQKSLSQVIIRIQLKESPENLEALQQKITDAVQDVFSRYHCAQPSVFVVLEKAKRHPKSLKLVRIKRDFDIN
ncbi:MAG: F390 synthetase-related protein [Candidatus Heimdallarchaeota archaeon]